MDQPSIIQLTSDDGARVTIHRHGAHVTSWVTPDGVERLFLSQRAEFAPNKAIRGGVPIIFPQFNQIGPLPRHGFARTSEWDVVRASEGAATLHMRIDDAARKLWPHDCEVKFEVRAEGNDLDMTLDVTNASDASFVFTCALHTYLRVSDVRAVQIDGLSGLRVADKVADKTFVEDAETVTIMQETDRIYYDVLGAVSVVEPGGAMWLKQAGFTDVVVWNPWTNAATLPDMESDGYLNMLCVEAASIGMPVTLRPGERWAGTQSLRAQS